MFYKSTFNNDISNWDVSNVKTMWGMFHESDFDKDISKWNISKDCDTSHMLLACPIREEFKPVFDKS